MKVRTESCIFIKRVSAIIYSYFGMRHTDEYNSNNAVFYNGNNGSLNNNNKNNVNSVRPVSDFCSDAFLCLLEDFEIAYRHCLRHKSRTANARRFKAHEIEFLVSLVTDIWNGEYVPNKSIAFIITKPKRREVIAADFRDRIVQHYIVERLECVLDKSKYLSERQYSCRIGKGNLAAVEDLARDIRLESKLYTSDCYVMTIDLESFFMRLDKRAVYDTLSRLIERYYDSYDKDTLSYLDRIITLSVPIENSHRKSPIWMWDDLPKDKSQYNLEWNLGFPIGNLNSQIDANIANAKIIKYIESLGIKVVNYVDDFALVHHSKRYILDCMPMIRAEFLKAGQTVHRKKTYLQHYSKGVSFLGLTTKYGRIYVGNKTVAKFNAKINYYSHLNDDQKRSRVWEYITIINSYLGLFVNCSSYKMRKRLCGTIIRDWGRMLYFDSTFSKATCLFPSKRQMSIEKAKATKRKFNKIIKRNNYESRRIESTPVEAA